MDLLQNFLRFVDENTLLTFQKRGLLAISGGIDSMVMLDLFERSPFPFAIAHVNFQLRPVDSDADEAFVRKAAKSLQLPFFLKRFDTAREAAKTHLSVQMTARALRYDWFEELAREEGFGYVATAHHLNDSLETLLLNIAKGTGIHGLRGVPLKRDFIVRPLLFANREQIEAYAAEREIEWREDTSNASDKYQRNWIRHKIIPMLKKINPSLEDTYQSTQRRLEGLTRVFDDAMQRAARQVVSDTQEGKSIDIENLLGLVDPSVQLYYLIEPYGFSFKQAQDVFTTLIGQSGAVFYSETHRLLRDRTALILEKKRISPAIDAYTIEASRFLEGKSLSVPRGEFHFQHIKRGSLLKIPTEPWVAAMDYSQLLFPLTFRRWQSGDHFQPLGMDKTKKLSDFFADGKLNRFQKERIWLLVDREDTILWVVSHRIAHHVRISEQTKGIGLVRFEKK